MTHSFSLITTIVMWYFKFVIVGFRLCLMHPYNTNRLVLELIISIVPIELDLLRDEKPSNQQSETRLI